jgi:chromosome segregation ATPase
MDHIDAIAEKIRDAIMGDLRKEFSEFKAEVRGQLDGFRIAIETMNKRMDSIERRMESMDQRISRIEVKLDEMNNKIDAINAELEQKN